MKNKNKNITHKKEEANVEFWPCLFLMIIVIVYILASIELRMIKSSKNYLDDGITASLLAAEIYDVEEYIAGNLCIDEERAYKLFYDTLKINLDLDSDFKTIDDKFFKDVRIDKFVIYNVKGNDVYEIQYTSLDTYTTIIHANGKGIITSPNGDVIMVSSAYADLLVTLGEFMSQEFEDEQGQRDRARDR